MIKERGSTFEVPTRVAGQVTTATQHLTPKVSEGSFTTTFTFQSSDLSAARRALERVGFSLQRNESMTLTTAIRSALVESNDQLFSLADLRKHFSMNPETQEQFGNIQPTATGFVAEIEGGQRVVFDFPFHPGAFDEIAERIAKLENDRKLATVVLDGVRYYGEVTDTQRMIGRDELDQPVHEGEPTGYRFPAVYDFDHDEEVTDPDLLKQVERELSEIVSQFRS